MPKFTYSARDARGAAVSGAMDANSVDECVKRLEGQSLTPVSVSELNFDGTPKSLSFFDRIGEWLLKSQNKVPYRDVVFFTRQLATMLSGGVSLPRALEQLGKSEKPVFKRIITAIGGDIGMGSTFSDAIAKHRGAFSGMFVSVVRAGEVAGSLDTVLDQLATYMENVEAMKAKVKAAMRYPAVVGSFVFLMTAGILIFLVPVFQNMYSGFGAKLPGPTLVLIAISDAIRHNAPGVAAGCGLFAGLVALLLNVDATNYLYHKYLLKLPVFGEILKKNILSVYCRTMSLLMDAGTPILEATQISGAAVNNRHYVRALESVYDDLKQGEMMSQALGKNPRLFPALITQLVSTGEESGKVDKLLLKAAEFYEREIKNVVDSLASIIEPVLIVALGGIVGSMLIALYLPVFSIGKYIR